LKKTSQRNQGAYTATQREYIWDKGAVTFPIYATDKGCGKKKYMGPVYNI